MSQITINGVTISNKGNNISIINGRIMVDGINVTPENQKEIKIEVIGDLNSLSCDMCQELVVRGDVRDLTSISGDVEVKGEVRGNVETTSGDVTCGNIGGHVETTSGDVDCEGNIGEKVSTVSGNIKYKK